MKKVLVFLIFKINKLRLINNREAKGGFSKASQSGSRPGLSTALWHAANGQAEVVEASGREGTVSQPSQVTR